MLRKENQSNKPEADPETEKDTDKERVKEDEEEVEAATERESSDFPRVQFIFGDGNNCIVLRYTC